MANNRGYWLMRLGRLDEALTASAQAVEVGRRLGGDRLALTLWTFAEVRLAAQRELRQALAAVEESVALYEASGRSTEARRATRVLTDIQASTAC